MEITRRHRRTGTLIWILMSLCVALLLLPHLGGSKRASPIEQFMAFRTETGPWQIANGRAFDIAYAHPHVASVYAMCWDEPASPIPILLPITTSVRCDINIDATQGTPPDATEMTAIRARVTQSLKNDPRWAGLPNTDGQRIRSFAVFELISTICVFACWLFARWITIWLVASAGVEHLGRGTCGKCGYPLDDLDSDVCPECGTPRSERFEPA